MTNVQDDGPQPSRWSCDRHRRCPPSRCGDSTTSGRIADQPANRAMARDVGGPQANSCRPFRHHDQRTFCSSTKARHRPSTTSSRQGRERLLAAIGVEALGQRRQIAWPDRRRRAAATVRRIRIRADPPPPCRTRGLRGMIRAALGGGSSPSHIETLVKRGFRLVAPLMIVTREAQPSG